MTGSTDKTRRTEHTGGLPSPRLVSHSATRIALLPARNTSFRSRGWLRGVAAPTDPKTDYGRSATSKLGGDRPEAGAAQLAGAAPLLGAAVLGNTAIPLEPPVVDPSTVLKRPPFLRLVPDPPPLPPGSVGSWGSLAELGPPGLALLAMVFTGWSLFRQRNEYEQRVRERGLTWREPPPSSKETASLQVGPPPEFVGRARRAWQNGLINYYDYQLALRTGVLTVDPGPGRSELMPKLMERLAKTKKDIKARQAVIDELLKINNSLTHIATHLKRMGQMEFATLEVAVAVRASGEKFLIAGLNSSADPWTEKQRKECEALGDRGRPSAEGAEERTTTRRREHPYSP